MPVESATLKEKQLQTFKEIAAIMDEKNLKICSLDEVL
jgi:hypothetical protein